MSQKKVIAIVLAVAMVAIVVIGSYLTSGRSGSGAPPALSPDHVAGPPRVLAASTAERGDVTATALPGGSTLPALVSTEVPADDATFSVDAAGKLVLNETTRLKVESLVALTPPDQLRAAAQAQVQGLPAAAAAEALDLVERYDAYQAAQKLSFAPDNALMVPEEGLAQLDGLHALRVSYFGSETAQSLFAEEEAVARKLLQLMSQDRAAGLTMDQRAVRAQAQYDALRAAPAAGSQPR